MTLQTTHVLKCQSPYFDAINCGDKKFEIREESKERHFEIGDVLHLREVEDDEYTGKEFRVYVKYILRHENFPKGIQNGYAVMTISSPWARKNVKLPSSRHVYGT